MRRLGAASLDIAYVAAGRQDGYWERGTKILGHRGRPCPRARGRRLRLGRRRRRRPGRQGHHRLRQRDHAPGPAQASEAGRQAGGLTAGDLPMSTAFASWQLWALLSAAFAALTAIFAKVGVAGVNSDLATFIRTVVILVVLGAILTVAGQWQPARSISGRTYLFLALSGLRDGRLLALLLPGPPDRRCRKGGAGRQAERRPRCDLRDGVFGRGAFRPQLGRHRARGAGGDPGGGTVGAAGAFRSSLPLHFLFVTAPPLSRCA